MKAAPLMIVAVMAMAASVHSQEGGQSVPQPATAPAATTSQTTQTIAPVVTGEFVPPAPRQPLPAIDESQVLSRACVVEGGRTITLEHIQPPDLPESSKIAHPHVPSLTPEEIAARRAAWLANRRAHPVVMLSLSGAVYDHKVTLLHWRHGDAEYQAWSNVDFNLLRGLPQVMVDGTTYHLCMMLWDESTTPRTMPSGRVVIPKSPQVPPLPEEPGFVVIQGDPSDEEALRAIRELHDYYNNNQDQLIAAYGRLLRYQAAAKAWEKEHPPQPENITIRLWNMSTEQAAGLKGGAQP